MQDPSAVFKCRHQKHPIYLRIEFNHGDDLNHSGKVNLPDLKTKPHT